MSGSLWRHRSCGVIRGGSHDEAGASKTSAFPSWSLGTRGGTRPLTLYVHTFERDAFPPPSALQAPLVTPTSDLRCFAPSRLNPPLRQIACHQHQRMAASPPFFQVMAYAVFTTGGKQYRVAQNDVIDVERLDGEPGAEITFSDLLLA